MFKTSLELGVNGGMLVMSFGSYKEIKVREVPVPGSAGLTGRINPFKVLDY